jgi:hypothetical protein
MARPRVADGGDCLQIWRAGASRLNKQSRTVDKWWPSRFGVGRERTIPHRKKNRFLQDLHWKVLMSRVTNRRAP